MEKRRIEESLSKAVGKRVKIKTREEVIEGLLVPSYESDVVLVKLKNGYNIGIAKKEIKHIEILGEVKKEKRTVKFKASKKEKIAVVVTGGTISSKVDYTTGAVSCLMEPAELLELAPSIQQVASLHVSSPFSVLSENYTPEHYRLLAEETCKLLNRQDIEGVIITHGTDTLHYTASLLSFVLKQLNKPVVFTYSQRSTDRGSSDATLNLECAARAALSDIAEILVVGHATLNDTYCLAIRGTHARKMHSTRRDTFRPVNELPIAKVWRDRIEIINHAYAKKDKTRRVINDFHWFDRVALLKFYPYADPKLIEYLFNQGYKGFIIEATGMGHVAIEGKRSWLPLLSKISKDAVICFTPQTLYGSLYSKVYATARKLEKAGCLFLSMLPETAYMKLSYLLGKWQAKKLSLEEVKPVSYTHLTLPTKA